MSVKEKNSISKIALRAMGIRIGCVIILVSLLSFWHNYQRITDRYQVEVRNYVKERAERESIYFNMARNNLEVLAQVLKGELSKNHHDFTPEFNQLFVKRPDGTYREKDFHLEDPDNVIMFMKRGVPLTKNMKRDMVTLHRVIGACGFSWRRNYLNVWAIGAEDYTLTYWPDYPKEVLRNPPPDYSFTDQEYYVVGTPENNPGGKTKWAGPYLDVATQEWMISINHPIYHEGKYILSLGMDILLTDFYGRSKYNVMEGTYNIVAAPDGRLISHPEYMDKIRKLNGKFYIQKDGSKGLQELFKKVTTAKSSVILDKENDVLLGIGRIEGPDWLIILVQPLSTLRTAARQTADFLIVIGTISLLIELLMLYGVLQKYVARPIWKLIEASDKMASGERDARVSVDTDNEIGHLGKSFNAMARKVQDRDQLLQNQAAELEVEVQKRTFELDVERARTYEASKLVTLGEFSGGVSHEINNPLSTIFLSIDSMKRRIKKGNVNPEDMTAFLNKVETTSHRISKIVKGLSAVSRNAEQDRIQPASVKSIIDSTLTLCEETLKGHSVSIECDDIPERTVLCREVQIVQALISIIQNSIDALEHTEDRKIGMHFQDTNGDFIIIVEDNGPGIPKDIQDKIFNPFFTTKELGKGTGLGLFIAYGMLKSNEGNLSFESRPGRTKFMVTLKKNGII